MLRDSSKSEVFLLGANFNTCSIEVRERLAVSSSQLETALDELTSLADEAVILSTCHRLEIYALCLSDEPYPPGIVDLVGKWSGLDSKVLLEHSYVKRGIDVSEHLFSVAAGLDSVVLGEGQVLAQVKDALSNAATFDAAGPMLSALFRHAVAVGKRVRSRTYLAEKDASLSRAAVELARDTLGDLSGKKALVIGAGKIGTLAAQELREMNVGRIDVTSRTASSARQLAAKVGARALEMSGLEDSLRDCDLAISSTSTSEAVLRYPQVRTAVAGREAPLLLIDLAVPRDVEPEVAGIEGVLLFDVDGLKPSANTWTPERRNEVREAEAIVAEGVADFQAWRREHDVIPAVAAMYRKAETIRERELARAMGELRDLTEREQQVLDSMTRAIVRKLLHHPATELKRAALEERDETDRKLLERLMGLAEN